MSKEIGMKGQSSRSKVKGYKTGSIHFCHFLCSCEEAEAYLLTAHQSIALVLYKLVQWTFKTCPILVRKIFWGTDTHLILSVSWANNCVLIHTNL